MEASRLDRCSRGPGMDSGRRLPASRRRMVHPRHALLPIACSVLGLLPHSAVGIVPWPGFGLAVIIGAPGDPPVPRDEPDPPPPVPCDELRDGSNAVWVCDDGNPCTLDECVGGYCQWSSLNGSSCSDGDYCTVNDYCRGTTCGGDPRDCDDGSICTDDYCDVFCHHDPTNEGATCAASSDPCRPWECLDGSCMHLSVTGPTCNDGDLCTEFDWCQNGVCAGTQINCGDGAVCTGDYCEKGICYHDPANSGATCESDNDPCTPDRCVGGTCIHTLEQYCIWLFPPVDPDLACTTYGCSMDLSLPEWIPVNNDDDNDNGVADFQETGAIPGEDDLDWVSWTALGCPPENGCTPCGHSGEDHWHPRGVPGALTMYSSLDRDPLVFNDGEPWPPPSGFYIEGRSDTGSCGDRWEFSVWGNEPPGYYCESVSDRIAVVKVGSLAWKEPYPDNLDLGTCGNNGGTKIYPGKTSPGDLYAERRKQVDPVATITPEIAGVIVYFRIWDVDDPFDQNNPNMANVNLIDNNTNGVDNRGDAFGIGQRFQVTDECGKAAVRITVSMQPGDNYRAAASVISEVVWGSGAQVTQDDADAIGANHSGGWSAYEVPAYWSKMLTVWRMLHVETDTMVRPAFAQNTFTMNWDEPRQGGAATQIELNVDDPFNNVFQTDTDQFVSGYTELSGTGPEGSVTLIAPIVGYTNSAFGDDLLLVNVPDCGNGQSGLDCLNGVSSGTAILSDDDLSVEATFTAKVWGCDASYSGPVASLSPPDLSALALRYNPAYIDPVQDTEASAVQGLVTFLRNIDFDDNDGKVLWDQALAARDLPVSTSNYWTAMVVTAWQEEEANDYDPNTEIDGSEVVLGISAHKEFLGNTESASSIGAPYTGVCAVLRLSLRKQG